MIKFKAWVGIVFVAILGNVSWANSYDACMKQLAPTYATMADYLCRDCKVLAQLGLSCDENQAYSQGDVFGSDLDVKSNKILIPRSPCGISHFCGPGPIFYWNGHMQSQSRK